MLDFRVSALCLRCISFDFSLGGSSLSIRPEEPAIHAGLGLSLQSGHRLQLIKLRSHDRMPGRSWRRYFALEAHASCSWRFSLILRLELLLVAAQKACARAARRLWQSQWQKARCFTWSRSSPLRRAGPPVAITLLSIGNACVPPPGRRRRR